MGRYGWKDARFVACAIGVATLTLGTYLSLFSAKPASANSQRLQTGAQTAQPAGITTASTAPSFSPVASAPASQPPVSSPPQSPLEHYLATNELYQCLPKEDNIISAATTHTIASGDTLERIANTHHIPLWKLEHANPSLNPLCLRIGATVHVPERVQRAYTLEDIDVAVRTVYGEARGESDAGKTAVLWVLRNRLEEGTFGESLASIAKQKSKKGAYAFSPWNPKDGAHGSILSLAQTDSAYRLLVDMALQVLAGGTSDNTDGATYFYNPRKVKKEPSWKKDCSRTVTIGSHEFYKRN